MTFALASAGIVLFALPALTVVAQSTLMHAESDLVVQPFDGSEIEVVAYDPSVHETFAELLSRREWAHVARIAVVVTNHSAQAIDGLVLQWALPTASNAAKMHTMQVDRFVREERTPILRAGGQALATPSGYITDAQIGQHFVTSALTSPSILSRVGRTTRIPMTLDSVIWDDGSVVGPDNFRIIEYIQSRHAVAHDLAQRVDEQRGNQVAIESVLSAFSDATKTVDRGNSHYAHWTMRLVGSARRDLGRLSRLAALPQPTLFRRN